MCEPLRTRAASSMAVSVSASLRFRQKSVSRLRSADLFASFCAAHVPSSLGCGGSGPSVRRERRAKKSRPASFDDGACSSTRCREARAGQTRSVQETSRFDSKMRRYRQLPLLTIHGMSNNIYKFVLSSIT
jgi:hypothetical protein